MNIQGIDFIALPAADMPRAVAFYKDVLGLSPGENFGDKFVEFEVGGTTLAIFDPAAMGQTFAPTGPAAVALRVSDVTATVAALKAAGVTFLAEPFDSGVCHGAFFQDSEGNALAVHHRYAPEAPGDAR